MDLTALPRLAPEAYTEVRRRAIFDCCKWDPQVEDVSVLAPYPLLLHRAAWRELAKAAEALAAETQAAERELLERPDLRRRLGLPRAVRGAMGGALNGRAPRGAARVIRFDFHPTPRGWRVSEANSDVPGGFIEASGFTRLMAAMSPGYDVPGDPAEALAGSVQRAAGPGALVGLIHATAYTDDRQVMIYLARRLEARGLRTRLASPADLTWRNGQAHAGGEPLALALRFYPAEWLPHLPRRTGWRHFFRGARTPLSNPATALATQSKRFALIWNRLETPMAAWRRLLPETRDPRSAPWRRGEEWVLKPALGRVGEAIGLRGVTPEKEWRAIARSARWRPGAWAAQRRFEAVPIETPDGPRHVCLGVFTVDGRAAGIYGRLAPLPLIAMRAQDVAVLIARQEEPPPCR